MCEENGWNKTRIMATKLINKMTKKIMNCVQKKINIKAGTKTKKKLFLSNA